MAKKEKQVLVQQIVLVTQVVKPSVSRLYHFSLPKCGYFTWNINLNLSSCASHLHLYWPTARIYTIAGESWISIFFRTAHRTYDVRISADGSRSPCFAVLPVTILLIIYISYPLKPRIFRSPHCNITLKWSNFSKTCLLLHVWSEFGKFRLILILYIWIYVPITHTVVYLCYVIVIAIFIVCTIYYYSYYSYNSIKDYFY